MLRKQRVLRRFAGTGAIYRLELYVEALLITCTGGISELHAHLTTTLWSVFWRPTVLVDGYKFLEAVHICKIIMLTYHLPCLRSTFCFPIQIHVFEGIERPDSVSAPTDLSGS